MRRLKCLSVNFPTPIRIVDNNGAVAYSIAPRARTYLMKCAGCQSSKYPKQISLYSYATNTKGSLQDVSFTTALHHHEFGTRMVKFATNTATIFATAAHENPRSQCSCSLPLHSRDCSHSKPSQAKTSDQAHTRCFSTLSSTPTSILTPQDRRLFLWQFRSK